MFPDFKELLRCLNAHDVKYLIVGGYAVSLHSQPRATKDLDLFIKIDPTNAKAIYAALADFGVALAEVSVEDLQNPKKFLRFGREPVAIDILTGIDGVEFDDVWHRRVKAIIDKTSGLTAFFISRDDLIASKLAAGRLRDLADVEDIRNAAKAKRASEEGRPDSSNGKSAQ